MSSKNTEVDLYKSFIPHRKEIFDFVQKLLSTDIELPSFNSSTLRQLKKRTVSLLIVSELDALASFIYGHNESKKAFTDMLIEWTKDELFSAVWPKKLIDFFEDGTGHSYREVLNKVESNIQSLKQQKFQSRDEYNIAKKTIIETLHPNILNDDQTEIFRDILWRISDEDGINSIYLEQYEAELKKKEGQKKYYQYAKPFFDQLGNFEFLTRDTIKQKLIVFFQSQQYEQKILDNTQNLILRPFNSEVQHLDQS